jgi:ABC-type glycerol-3-phosphate transport system substrate-binding protein
MRHWTAALVAGFTGLMAASGAYAQQHVLNMLMLAEDSAKIQKVVDAYQAKHPDVVIKMQSAPWDQYFQTAELRLGSKDKSIDLVYVDVPLIASYASRGFLAPVDPGLDTSALVSSSVNAGKYDGKLYALPINNSAQVLYFNKKLFADAGVTPPAGLTPGGTATQAQADEIASTKRWTWEQVADAAQKLTQKKGGKTAVWGFSMDQINELYQLQPLGESLGTDVIAPDGKTAHGYLDSPAWVKGATFWSDLYNKWQVSPKGLAHDEPPHLFANGQLALFAGGTWNLALFQKSGVDFGVAAFPYFQGGKILTPTGSWFMGVSADSANKEIAADFAKFLTLTDEGTKIWFDANKQLPAYKPLLEQISKSPEFDGFPNDVFRIGVYDALNTAKPRPTTVAYGQLQDAFRTAFADISNGVAVDDALATAVETYDAAIKRVSK